MSDQVSNTLPQLMEAAAERAHTPGPWRLRPASRTNRWSWIIEGFPPYGWVATTHVPPGAELEEVKANACVLAAAPKMLEALRALWDASEAAHPDSEMGRALALAQEAIAQADGLALTDAQISEGMKELHAQRIAHHEKEGLCEADARFEADIDMLVDGLKP